MSEITRTYNVRHVGDICYEWEPMCGINAAHAAERYASETYDSGGVPTERRAQIDVKGPSGMINRYEITHSVQYHARALSVEVAQ